MIKKLKRFLRRADIYFDYKLGWFFTNGRNQEARIERIKKEIEENGKKNK
jgi:hypothetical protein